MRTPQFIIIIIILCLMRLFLYLNYIQIIRSRNESQEPVDILQEEEYLKIHQMK